MLIVNAVLEFPERTKILVKSLIPREQPKQNKKIAYPVLLSLFMRDNEVQHHSYPLAPAWAVLDSQY